MVVQALRLNTMSKLTFADTSRFDALVKDVFSGVDFTTVEDQTLVRALEEVYQEAQLELIPSQVCFYEGIINRGDKGVVFSQSGFRVVHTAAQKCFLCHWLQLKKALELHEQLRQRMGVVIVGPSGAGKSTLWKMLRAAVIRTGKVVRPKQLFL